MGQTPVFDLLGSKEDDVTYSLGWALANSDSFTRALIAELSDADPGEIAAVRLQEFVRGGGRTDIEIDSAHVHLILEAKRGWELPSDDQLGLYAERFNGDERKPVLAVASDCSDEFAKTMGFLNSKRVAGHPVKHLSWSKIASLAANVSRTSRNHSEKRLMNEVHGYLKGLMTAQDIYSNMVYIVALGQGDLFGTGESFRTIVTDHDLYFHPFGRGGWPKSPPNYMGFRYNGKLQSIRHVDSSSVGLDPWNEIPRLKGKTDWPEEPHAAYRLGLEITPQHEVRTGDIYRNARVWSALDLLLTSATIREARDLSKAREESVGDA